MKKLTFTILMFLSASSFGQQITFTIGTLVSQDSDIIAVRDLWKSYVAASKNENDRSVFNFWNKDETERGFTDIVLSTTPNYSFLNTNVLTFEIKKAENQFYRIRNILTIGNKDYNEYTLIYDVYAKKDLPGYKLYNSFYVNRTNLQHYQTDNIDFYYQKGFSFNEHKAKEVENIYSGLIKIFGNPNKHKVVYIIGNNLDEAYNNIGIEYTPFSSTSLFAGFSVKNQNVILTCRENHLHELVHTILRQYNGSTLFQEGIAAYYGGSAGVSYPDLISQFRKIIISNPDIDISKFDELDSIVNNGNFNNYYTIGAIFIDYANKRGGPEKVLALFKYEDIDSFKFDGAIKAIEKELGIKNDQINSFLKQYIINYKGV
jgi:hypothetical protein